MLDPYSSDPLDPDQNAHFRPVRIQKNMLPAQYGKEEKMEKEEFLLLHYILESCVVLVENIENIYLFNSCDIDRTDVSAIVHGILSIQDTRA